jgi:anti-sigma B factor antagonist
MNGEMAGIWSGSGKLLGLHFEKLASRLGRRWMEVDEKKENGVYILVLKGRLDSNTSDQFGEKLYSLIQAGENKLVLDLAGVDYISSAGLRVIIKSVKDLKRNDGKLCLCSMKDYIREVFDLSGIATILPIHPTLEESLRAF